MKADQAGRHDDATSIPDIWGAIAQGMGYSTSAEDGVFCALLSALEDQMQSQQISNQDGVEASGRVYQFYVTLLERFSEAKKDHADMTPGEFALSLLDVHTQSDEQENANLDKKRTRRPYGRGRKAVQRKKEMILKSKQ